VVFQCISGDSNEFCRAANGALAHPRRAWPATTIENDDLWQRDPDKGRKTLKTYFIHSNATTDTLDRLYTNASTIVRQSKQSTTSLDPTIVTVGREPPHESPHDHLKCRKPQSHCNLLLLGLHCIVSLLVIVNVIYMLYFVTVSHYYSSQK
jgi:hypothetical protein